jgi:hypothetical protein
MTDRAGDAGVFDDINELTREEHELWQKEARHEATDADRKRLQELQVLLDQCWDLLHQRRGLRDAGLDPDEASVRKSEIVEGYDETKPYEGRETE